MLRARQGSLRELYLVPKSRDGALAGLLRTHQSCPLIEEPLDSRRGARAGLAAGAGASVG